MLNQIVQLFLYLINGAYVNQSSMHFKITFIRNCFHYTFSYFSKSCTPQEDALALHHLVYFWLTHFRSYQSCVNFILPIAQ